MLQFEKIKLDEAINSGSALWHAFSAIKRGEEVARPYVMDQLATLSATDLSDRYPGLTFLLSQMEDLVAQRWPEREKKPAFTADELELLVAALRSIEFLGVGLREKCDPVVKPTCFIPILNGILTEMPEEKPNRAP